jgi:parallel beta-helix repeat protein
MVIGSEYRFALCNRVDGCREVRGKVTATISNRSRTVLSLVGLTVLLALFVIGSQVVAAAQATGNVYYVATNGNDSNPGTIEQPWKTIQKAANTLQAGDTVLIRGGVYVSELRDNEIIPSSSGTVDRYITYKAFPGESVTIQGRYPSLNDNNWFGFEIAGQSYLQIEGLTIKGFHTGVTCRAPGHHIIIKNNTFEYNSEAGISSEGAASGTRRGCDYLTIIGNRSHHNGYYENGQPATGPYEGWSSGISINPDNAPFMFDTDYSVFHTVISGNTIYHNYDAVGDDRSASQSDVDNDADHTDGNGIIIDSAGNFPPVLIENNVVFDNGGRGIEVFDSQNVWIIGNTCFKNNTDSLFIGPETKSEIGAFAGPLGVQPKNIHILNNLAQAADGVQITYFPQGAASGLDMRNNLWYGRPYRETYSPYGIAYVRADPLFVHPSADPQTADFRLRANSPAINIGANVAQIQLVDFDNNPRPQSRPQGTGYDAGAYEYTGQIVAPTPVPPTGTQTRRLYLPSISKNR